MASISTDKSGNRRILFFNAAGERKTLRVGKMPMRTANTVKTHVEELVNAAAAATTVPLETANWLGNLDATLRGRLAAVGLASPVEGKPKAVATLGPFLDAFIAARSGTKESTLTVYRRARRYLLGFFKADKPLAEITIADASAWRRWMGKPNPEASHGRIKENGLSVNTANRACGIARQFFTEAVDARLIAENSFRKLKDIGNKANRSRDYYVTRDEAAKVLAACPDAKWKLIFALARYGGLRTPSEPKALTWADVQWAAGRIRIDSPKTGERFIPIFPELRPHLEAALREASDKAIDDPATPVVDHPQSACWNFGSDLVRIICAAGLSPWPKLFQNLRATRATELAQSWPIHVVCEWMGHKAAISQEFYLRVTDADFAKAGEQVRFDEAAHKAAHKAAHYGALQSDMERHCEDGQEEIPENLQLSSAVFFYE